jgi:hypothetical protein
LDDYANLTLDAVKISTHGIQEWGDDHNVWAQTIVTQLVSNSCDSDLHQRVTEKMIGIDEYEVGGATYFKMAIECITSMSHTVSMSLSIKISNMTIQQFTGENVISVISAVRGATERLKMSGMLPPHLPIILYKIFQSSTCIKFNNFFAALYAREEADIMLFGPSKRLPSDTLFRIAEHQHRTMLEDGSWTVVGKKVSNFNTETKESTDEARPLPPWKTPPKTGKPHEREFKGRLEYWCEKCGWNCTHPTGKHQTKGELKAAHTKSNTKALTGPATVTKPTANNAEKAVSFASVPDAAATPLTSTQRAASNASFLMTGIRR